MKKFASFDYKGQENNKLELGDVMRYTMDSHDINLSINNTYDEIIVSLTMGSAYVGTYILDCFWSFDNSELDKARKLYKELATKIKPILARFVKEKIPTSLLCPFLRKEVAELNKADYIKTNIPVINYSYDLPVEGDWRETLYGNRYPKYKEESFTQYTNSSYYTKDNRVKGKFSM
jgi:hypothetical protein